MTRDEAIKKAEACFQFNVPSQEWFFNPIRLVAALENLGMLKLDEPKSAQQKLDEILVAYLGASDLHSLRNEMDGAGLKIVEK